MTSDADAAYANAPHIPGAADYPPRWAGAAAAFRAGSGARARLDLAYGPGERQRYDLFLPEGPAQGLTVFVHGGYWLAFGRGDWSHLAAGPLGRGWAVAMPSYTLAPAARIAAMTAEIGAAVAAAAGQIAGPVVVTGHSAGGQLAARMACIDAPLPVDVAGRIVRVVPVSPLADLVPLIDTAMNARLRLDAAEAAAESPARLRPRPGLETLVWVGGQERPAFLWQARLLAETWACPWHVEPGRHHFDVLDDLAETASALTAAVTGN
ncbi:alpha/beta hydrolase [Ruixingdingia sedimenti]|uniref:Alpha/beta fold hydrolase n=1 Tax=Ruixingdingia sedimenti TaxID=3073604 RepID=A0ABU1FCM9_9RHOB|nr:alpha/beta hydrolase fold domain-containing protein [Xinfangfangia sp. LG-4]MDR5654648.1 alpha/beta fold hydrolase [Xinfangfangia sp. LG-4]